MPRARPVRFAAAIVAWFLAAPQWPCGRRRVFWELPVWQGPLVPGWPQSWCFLLFERADCRLPRCKVKGSAEIIEAVSRRGGFGCCARRKPQPGWWPGEDLQRCAAPNSDDACGAAIISALPKFNPTTARRRFGTRSREFQKSCALFSGRSSRSSTETGFPRPETTLPARFAWRAGWQYSADSL